MTGVGEREGTERRGVHWSLIVPVKHLGRAKSRLARAAGPHRSELALAIACDTVAAARTCPEVAAVFAVTEDPRAGSALAELGAVVVRGEPGTGLNPALEHGAAVALRRLPELGVCALSADLPALRPTELSRVLAAASAHPLSFLADSPGVGTTLLAAREGSAFSPAFEGASRDRHLSLGARELVVADSETVRRDVDTPDDLRAAAVLGVGPRTRSLLDRLEEGLPDSGHTYARALVEDPGVRQPAPSGGEATSCPR